MKLSLGNFLLFLFLLLLAIKTVVLYRYHTVTHSSQQVSDLYRVDEEIRRQLDNEAQEHFNSPSDFSSFSKNKELDSSVFSF